MDRGYRVAVVDDVPAMRALFQGLLKADYEVSVYANGREFIDAGDDVDAVLLDIEMPDLNGYDTCRQLRASAQAATPVIFVSGHDSEEDRIAAYQAGGDDFIIKPIVADEVRIKVEAAVARKVRLAELEAQSSRAEQIAASAMGSLDGLRVIAGFLHGSSEIVDASALAYRVLEALHGWGLRGAVRLRVSDGFHDACSDELSSPLQASVMESLSDMGRLFQMRSRAVVNFAHVTLLVENLPIEDPEALTSAQENLTMLGEAAEGILRGLGSRSRDNGADAGAIDELRTLWSAASARVEQSRAQLETCFSDLDSDLHALLRGFGMTDVQRAMVADELSSANEAAFRALDGASAHLEQLAQLLARLAPKG